MSVFQVQSVTQLSSDGSSFKIQLQTNQIAIFVWLEAIGIPGYFSENGFIFIRPQTSVCFYSWEADVTTARLSSSLKITSLMDVYS